MHTVISMLWGWLLLMKKSLKANVLLRQAREERGWTQGDLARAMRVGETTVRSWERGDRFPSVQIRYRLCQVLEKTLEQLGLQPLDEEVLLSQEFLSSVPPSVDLSFPSPSEGEVVECRQKVPFWLVRYQDQNRQRMLRRVCTIWIEGVLSHSLHQEVLIALGLQEQPDALANPWRFAVQETSLPPRPLPSGTSITQVYDDAHGELLILGEPGVGKTTLLLELARELLTRAESDSAFPLPVVFHLSSWAVKRLQLEDWLVDELSSKYWVPQSVGKEWVRSNQLLVLLDGLDEVEEMARSACVQAINAYRQAYVLVSLVVCCRRREYYAQDTRVALQRAVLVQPLTEQQIDKYLSCVGGQLEVMRKALDEDVILREMVRTPLMLGILVLAYGGETRMTLVAAESYEAQREHIFAVYVQRMLSRRGVKWYTQAQMTSWLVWLARQMQMRGQTEFYLERIQPDWLPDRVRERYRMTVFRLVFGIEVLVLSALAALFRGDSVPDKPGLFFWLGGGLGNSLLGWMAPGLGGLTQGSGSLMILHALISALVTLLVGRKVIPTLSLRIIGRALWDAVRIGLTYGGVLGVFSAVVFFLGGWVNAIEAGLNVGVFSGVLLALLGGLMTLLGYGGVEASQRRLPLLRSIGDCLLNSCLFSVCGGFGFACLFALQSGEIGSSIQRGIVIGFFYGITYGFGRGRKMIPELGKTIKPAEIVGWSWHNVGCHLVDHMRKGVVLGLCMTVWVIATITCMSSVFSGVAYGLRYGLVFGLIVGCIGGMASLLATILTSGWSSELIGSESQFLKPNEGIHRSIRNAFVAALLFGVVGAGVGGLACSLAFGFAGIAGWPILGMGFALICGINFAFQFLVLRGGIACVEHYVLRYYLWRIGSLPWNAPRFLDHAAESILLSKVGGGYIFPHRMILDYFAGMGKEICSKHKGRE
jgi:transcriptional regulator with XRE-family HTH domain/DNA polymerase III delta prime subunit